LMLYLGCFFIWGNIAPYVESYFYFENPNVSYGFIFLVDTLLVLFNWFGYNLGTFLLNTKNWSPKIVILIGGVVSLAGIYASSFTKDISTYLFLYACFNGVGCGMCYFVPLVCGWEYFPSRKGLVTGIVISAYGFGAFGFGLLAVWIVNPTHVNPSI